MFWVKHVFRAEHGLDSVSISGTGLEEERLDGVTRNGLYRSELLSPSHPCFARQD
jgi:hypothetical protein